MLWASNISSCCPDFINPSSPDYQVENLRPDMSRPVVVTYMSAFRQVGLFSRDRVLLGQHNSILSPSPPPALWLSSVFPGVLWLCIVAESLYLTLLFTGGALMILEQCPCFSVMNKLKLSAFAALCTALSGNAAKGAQVFCFISIAVLFKQVDSRDTVWCWRGFLNDNSWCRPPTAVIKLVHRNPVVSLIGVTVIQTLLRGRAVLGGEIFSLVEVNLSG